MQNVGSQSNQNYPFDPKDIFGEISPKFVYLLIAPAIILHKLKKNYLK